MKNEIKKIIAIIQTVEKDTLIPIVINNNLYQIEIIKGAKAARNNYTIDDSHEKYIISCIQSEIEKIFNNDLRQEQATILYNYPPEADQGQIYYMTILKMPAHKNIIFNFKPAVDPQQKKIESMLKFITDNHPIDHSKLLHQTRYQFKSNQEFKDILDNLNSLGLITIAIDRSRGRKKKIYSPIGAASE